MILSQKESRHALDSGQVENADCETPGCVSLPDGDRNAERIIVSKSKRTGKLRHTLCAPWLLTDMFAQAEKGQS